MSDKFFDGGGAIDTDDNDRVDQPSDAPPAAAAPGAIDTGDESTAPAPQAAASRPQPQDGLQAIADAGKQTPMEGAQQFPGNVKKIVSYLMGMGAAPPEAIDQAGSQVDPHGQMSPDDRNILAVDKASKEGGPQAAWALVQSNRVAFNAKQAFAQTALNGIDGKPADINAAATAATQASQHVLDGSNTTFQPNQQGGVTATVKMPGGQPQQINLTPAQFNQYLNVGGDGQWDKLMEGSVPATLQKISQSQGMPLKAPQAPQGAQQGMARSGAPAPSTRAPMAPQAQAPQAPQPGAQPTQNEAPQAPQPEAPAPLDNTPAPGTPPSNFGTTPSTMNLSGNQAQRPPVDAPDSGYGGELEARASKMFPYASQESQRQAWMSAQEEKELERSNKIDVASETGKQRIKVAEATGRGRVDAAATTGQSREAVAKTAAGARMFAATQAGEAQKQKVQMELQRQARINTNAQQRNAAAILGHKINNEAITPLTDQEKAMVNTLVQGGASQAAPQAPAAGQTSAPGQPGAGKKQFNGKWYTQQEYESQVLGK
jgi:hypothetical protein